MVQVGIEANIFSRIGRVIRSYTNALISKAEDPEKMIDQSVNEMQEDLQKVICMAIRVAKGLVNDMKVVQFDDADEASFGASDGLEKAARAKVRTGEAER